MHLGRRINEINEIVLEANGNNEVISNKKIWRIT